jgi:hypothetical protein
LGSSQERYIVPTKRVCREVCLLIFLVFSRPLSVFVLLWQEFLKRKKKSLSSIVAREIFEISVWCWMFWLVLVTYFVLCVIEVTRDVRCNVLPMSVLYFYIRCEERSARFKKSNLGRNDNIQYHSMNIFKNKNCKKSQKYSLNAQCTLYRYFHPQHNTSKIDRTSISHSIFSPNIFNL